MPYELGLSFIALCLCVVLAVLVERRAARAPGRAASFHLLRALVVFSTLAVPLALSCSGVLTVSRRWRGRGVSHHATRRASPHRCSAAPPRPVSHAITLLGACTAMMKLLSYAHTNAELRRKYITTGAQTKLRRIQSSNDDLDAVAGEGDIAQPNAYPANLRLRRCDAVHGVSDTHIPDAVSPHETYSKCLVVEEDVVSCSWSCPPCC